MNSGIKVNREGVRELLKSDEMLSICTEHAQQVKLRAGEGYEMAERHYKNRNGVAVIPVTPEAKKDNNENNTLLKSIG